MPSFSYLLISAFLASLSTAHVSLENPKPYKLVADGLTNPVLPTGADFPCRIPEGKTYIIDGERTPMVIGEDQLLSFSGHAVHGGGSCQIALSPGFPTKDSSWKVIHSIEGGCPARNQIGNIEGPNEDKYYFRIPEGIEPGDWTLSWTWVSRIGGVPEFYQNCGPVTVLPAKTSKRMSFPERRREDLARRHEIATADFPELFMANMHFAGGCTTSDAQHQRMAIAFPDPGTSVERPEGSANLYKQACDGNPRKRVRIPEGGAVDIPMPADSGAPSSAPSVFVTSSLAPEPTAIPHAEISTTTTAQMTSSSSAPIESSPAMAAPCTEGQFTCLPDGTHFAICTGGQLTAPQPIASGFKCKPGSVEISPL